jgi:hypothetical protein
VAVALVELQACLQGSSMLVLSGPSGLVVLLSPKQPHIDRLSSFFWYISGFLFDL